jgi:hypothetical protein
MSKRYKKLREQIFTLHDLLKTWSSSDIADELQNSDCPPSQTRRALIRYIKYLGGEGELSYHDIDISSQQRDSSDGKG